MLATEITKDLLKAVRRLFFVSTIVVPVTLLLLMTAASVAAAQAEPLRQCLLRAGVTDEATFVAFDRELRQALSIQDLIPLIALVRYPLAINDETGTISIADAATLAARIGDAIPLQLRKRVLATAIGDVICTNSGIGYGAGSVWISVLDQGGRQRFVISTINLFNASTRESPRIAFVCRADDHRVVIDRTANGRLRYRSWNRPKSLVEPSDLEISSGTEAIDGRGACAYRAWTFRSGNVAYVVSEHGCQPDSGGPPPESTGDLVVTIGGSERLRSWCY